LEWEVVTRLSLFWNWLVFSFSPSTPVLFRLSNNIYKSIKWMGGLYGVTVAGQVQLNTMNFAVEMVEQLNWHSSAARRER
jgi:hypothetical protein